jgi:ElaB/YqjD/DUF883 family membrane-anchored ribosome-binding protein
VAADGRSNQIQQLIPSCTLHADVFRHVAAQREARAIARRNKPISSVLIPARGTLPMPGKAKMTRTLPTSSEQSIEALRQESERTRDELATTVGALRERVGDTATELKTMVSPAHIKQEIKDYVRQERESLIDTMQRKARENPLQVAAIGAAIAYPAWSLLRAVPTPLWLIGAGLFLTTTRGQQTVKEVQAKVDDTVQQASEKVSEVATSIQSDLEGRVAGVRDTVAEARDAASAKVGSLTDKAGSLTEQARAAFHDAHDAITGAAGNAAAQASAAADRVATTGAETAGNLKDRAAGMATSSQNAVVDFVKQNPLLVAGVGAAVGALIAASIPPSEAENRLFGSGSEKVKDKAREAAAEGIERAGEAVAAVAGAAASAAAREGLDASGVQDALSKVAGSVRKVADRGLDAALGGAPPSSPSDQPTQPQPIQQQPLSERTPT